MPIDFSKLPDQHPVTQTPRAGGIDLSGLPDQTEPEEDSHKHPYWAAAARIAGGVGSALAQPLEMTGIGTAVPAAIAGLGETAAEWLEGSPLSPARIGTEAALGAVPFGYLTKAGKLGKFLGQTGASMTKAGAISGVGEGARELAQGESLSPTSIGTQAVLGAGTYGVLSKLLHGRTPKPPAGQQFEVVPTAHEGGSVLSGKAVKGVTRMPVKAPSPITASVNPPEMIQPPFGTRMAGLAAEPHQAIGGDFLSPELSAAEKAEQKLIAQQAEANAKLAEERLTAQGIVERRETAGYRPDPPTYTEGLTGKAEDGTVVREGQTFSLPEKNDTRPPIEFKGDLITPDDPRYDKLAAAIERSKAGVQPTPHTPIEAQPPIVAEPQAPPAPAEPPAPSTPLARALSPRRRTSLRTPEGFQSAVDRNLAANPVTEAGNGGITAPPVAPLVEPPAPIAPQGPQNAPGTTPTSPPGSPLARVFKTRLGQTGHAYGEAKAAGVTGEELARIRDEHLVSLGREPEGLAGLGEPTPDMVESPGQAAPDTRDWVQRQLDAIRDFGGNEEGGINPGVATKLGATAGGAVIGAPVGEYLDPDDPNAAVKGALVGAGLGYGASGGANGLITMRNAGLLATPAAQLKKPISDFSAYLAKAAETPVKGQGMKMLREIFNPVNFKNAADAFRNPDLAQDVIGDSARAVVPPSTGLMRQVTRPFAAAQHATTQAMIRSGISADEAKNVLFLGRPNFSLFQKWLDAQKLEGPAGQIVRAVRPFARIGTNIFERGVQRIPGVAMIPKLDAAIGGDPQTKWARTALGAGAVGLGALVGAGDTDSEELGEEETSPLIRGLRRAALASYGIPFMLGESLTGPRGIRDLVYATPGATQTIPPPAPKDTIFTYGKKFGKRWADQMIPDWLDPSDITDVGIR